MNNERFLYLTKTGKEHLLRNYPGYRGLLSEIIFGNYPNSRKPVLLSTKPKVLKLRLNDNLRVLVQLGKDSNDNHACIVSGVFEHDEACKKSEFFKWLPFEECVSFESLINTSADEDIVSDCQLFLSRVFATFVSFENIIDPENAHLADFRIKPIFTPEQASILNTQGPLMIQGSSGTGKTLCLLERLSLLQNSGRRVYLALHNYVVEEIKVEASHYWNIENLNIDFYTISSFFKSLIVTDIHVTEREFNYYDFKEWWLKQHSRFSPEIAWEEIRGTIKGSARNNINCNSRLIALEDYQSLGRNQSDIERNERPSLYFLAQKYDNYLINENRIDDQDVALRILEQRIENGTAAIAIDEVQDLTMLQLQVLLLQVQSPDGFICAGDINQKLFPSGFRWEDLKSIIRDLFDNRGRKITPEVHLLSNKLRSRSHIVDFGNLWLKRIDITQKYIGARTSVSIQRPLMEDNCKIFLLDRIGNINEFLRKVSSLPSRIVLVPDETMKLDLQEIAFTFTVQEFKGLECSTVIMAGFLVWLSKSGKEYLHQLMRTYVASTRAQDNVFIIESGFVTDEDILSICHRIDAEELIKEEHVSSTEWHAAYEWYRRHGQERASRDARKEEANSLKRENHFDDAATIYHELNMIKEMAECLAFLIDKKKAAYFYEEIGYFEDAARVWFMCNEIYNSARCWQKANNYVYAADLWFELEIWDKAAECNELAERYDNAANCWEEFDDLYKAGECWEKASDYYKALKVWSKTNDYERMALCYQRIDRYEDAARCWEQINEYNHARTLWIQLQEWEKAAFCCEIVGQYNIAAEYYEKSNNYIKACAIWDSLKEWEEAAKCSEKANNYINAVKYCEKYGDYDRAFSNILLLDLFEQKSIGNEIADKIFIKALTMKKSEKYLEAKILFVIAAKYYQFLGRLDMLAECYELNEEYKKAGRIWKQLESWENAAECFRNADDKNNEAISLELSTHYYDAALVWLELKQWSRAAICLEKAGLLAHAAKAWEYAGNIDKAVSIWCIIDDIKLEVKMVEKTEILEKRAINYCNMKQWKKAAQIYKHIGRYSDAVECWKRGGHYSKYYAYKIKCFVNELIKICRELYF